MDCPNIIYTGHDCSNDYDGGNKDKNAKLTIITITAIASVLNTCNNAKDRDNITN